MDLEEPRQSRSPFSFEPLSRQLHVTLFAYNVAKNRQTWQRQFRNMDPSSQRMSFWERCHSISGWRKLVSTA